MLLHLGSDGSMIQKTRAGWRKRVQARAHSDAAKSVDPALPPLPSPRSLARSYVSFYLTLDHSVYTPRAPLGIESMVARAQGGHRAHTLIGTRQIDVVPKAVLFFVIAISEHRVS